MKRQRGFILIYVVGLIAALAMILYQLNLQRTGVPQQLERQLDRALEGREARLLLEFVAAGLQQQDLSVDARYLQFKQLLLEDPTRLSELDEALSQLKSMLDQLGFNIEGARGKSGSSTSEGSTPSFEGKDVLFAPRATPYSLRLGERAYTIHVLPGNALPNLNSLPFLPMARYLQHLGLAESKARELAADLVDWRDRDNFKTESIGAEQDYYLNLQHPYPPRNGGIQHWQELAFVRGVGIDTLPLLRANFMLRDARLSSQVLADYMTPEAIATLADLKPDIVRLILKEYGRLNSKDEQKVQSDVAEVLLTKDAEAFDRVVVFKESTDTVRIEIVSEHITLTADYDTAKKHFIAVW
ncbi:MAG TPA: hypothetical protein VI279_00240 [Rhodocyclaceae bacterium]